MNAILTALVTLSALLAAPQKGERWPRPDLRVDCGPLVIEVHLSETAHRFHLVDQLSAWDNACHGQYRRNMSLSDVDEAVLAVYAEMRSEKRWGQGLEQTFYTPLDTAAAVKAGLAAGRLSREQARIATETMAHFAERTDALFAEHRERLLGAFDAVDREAFAEAARKLARFTGVKKLVVPAFPIASPEGGGGGMDGGRLRWEISDEGISPAVLLHECTHGFFLERQDTLDELVEATPGMSGTLLGEGFAYALAPGMYPFRDGDPLAHNVAQDRCGSDTWDGKTGYGMQRMFGLALRPLLAEAFESGQSLEEFLPRARDAFQAVHAVMMAREQGPPTAFIGGRGRDVVRERLDDSKYRYSMHRFNLASADSFENARTIGRSGDVLVILVSGEDDEEVPRQHADLLPMPADRLAKQLRAGKSVELEHTLGPLRILLLAGPTDGDVEDLARSSELLAR